MAPDDEFGRAFDRVTARFRLWHAIDAVTYFLIVGGFVALFPTALSKFVVLDPLGSVHAVFWTSVVLSVVFSAWAIKSGAPSARFVARTIDRVPADELLPTAADIHASNRRGPLEDALLLSASRHMKTVDASRFRPLGQSSRVMAASVVWLLLAVLGFFPSAAPSEAEDIDQTIREILAKSSDLSDDARRALASVAAQKTADDKRAALDRAAAKAADAVKSTRVSRTDAAAVALADAVAKAATPADLLRLAEKIDRARKDAEWSKSDAATVAAAAKKKRESAIDPETTSALDQIDAMLANLGTGSNAGSVDAKTDGKERSDIAAAESFRRVVLEAYAELGMAAPRSNDSTTTGPTDIGDRTPRFDRAEFAEISSADRPIAERFARMRWSRTTGTAAPR